MAFDKKKRGMVPSRNVSKLTAAKNVNLKEMDALCVNLHRLIYDFQVSLFFWEYVGENAELVDDGGRGKTFWIGLQEMSRDMMVLTICKIYDDYRKIFRSRLDRFLDAKVLFVAIDSLAEAGDFKMLLNLRNSKIGHLKPQKPDRDNFWIPGLKKLNVFLNTAKEFLEGIRDYLAGLGGVSVAYYFDADTSRLNAATRHVFELWLAYKAVPGTEVPG